MNLADRLQRRTPCGYGRFYYYEYRGIGYFHKRQLIKDVVEKYAVRFGAVSNEKANQFYERLAKKYCFGIGWRACYRAIEVEIKPGDPVYFSHPIEEKKKSLALRLSIKLAKQQVDHETKNYVGNYCVIDSQEGCCLLCGKSKSYILVGDTIGMKRCYMAQKGFYSVCRRPMCKALVQKFPKQINSRSMLPMAKIIMEITKNGDRSEITIQLKEISLRDTYTTHKKKKKKKESKGNSHACN